MIDRIRPDSLPYITFIGTITFSCKADEVPLLWRFRFTSLEAC